MGRWGQKLDNFMFSPLMISLTALCSAGVWKTFDLESLIFLAIWQIMWMPGIQQQRAEGIESHVMRGTKGNIWG